MEPATPPDRAALMRAAGDVLGSEALARGLNIKPRTIYALMAGTRAVKDSVLIETRALLVRRRQRVGAIVSLIRTELQP